MIARRSALVYLTNAVGAVLGYVGLFLVARLMPNPQEAVGLVAFGLGFVGSFFVLTNLGIPRAHAKRVSEGQALDRCLGTFALLQGVQVALAVGATFLALWIWTGVLGRGFETPLHGRVIYVMLLYYLALNLGGIGNSTFNARLEAARSQASNFTGTVVRVGGMALVALAGLGPLELAWAYAAGAVGSAGAVLVLLRGYSMGRPDWGLTKSYLRFAFPLAIPTTLGALSIVVDKAVIQLFWGAAEVGYYFVSQRILQLLAVVTSAVAILLLPSVSRFHARQDVEGLRTKATQAERYLSMVMAPFAALLIAYPEGIIHILFSDDFLPGTDTLRVFGLVAYVGALNTPRHTVLQGMDRSDLSGMAGLTAALVTLVLFPLLIPTSIFGVPLAGLGAEGAALSALAGGTVGFVLVHVFSYRVSGIRVGRAVALHLPTALLLVYGFTLILPPALGLGWRWFHLLGLAGLFGGAYLTLLAILREFRKEDLLLFLDVLNPWKMALYVRDELSDAVEED